MKAIRTNCYGPTSTRGSLIEVTDDDGNTKWYSYSNSVSEPHIVAAESFLEAMSWKGVWIGGRLSDGMVFVHSDGEAIEIVSEQ